MADVVRLNHSSFVNDEWCDICVGAVRALATRLCCEDKKLLRLPGREKRSVRWELIMPDTKPTAPLDLSAFDNLDPHPRNVPTLPSVAQPLVAAAPRLVPEPVPERLVEIANLGA